MATKRVKDNDRLVVDQEPVLEDRLSDLPDDVILNILSRLSTIVSVRMSLVSKRWRRMWTLFPFIDINTARDVFYFRELYSKRIGHKELITYITKFLSHYPVPSTTVSKFKLQMHFYRGYDQVDGWLKHPLLKNVKELELAVHSSVRRGPCNLPKIILRLRQLTCMSLRYFVWKADSLVWLPSLKELRLVRVSIDNQTVNNLLLGCTSLEKLRMIACSGFSDPEFSSSSLKHMEFCQIRSDTRRVVIKVKAINLQSFAFDGYSSQNCSFDLARCHSIRNISLSRAFLNDQWFHNYIPKLTLLESLNLSNCFGMQYVKIDNPQMKSFVFDSDLTLDSLETMIYTPSLEHFSYSSISTFKISLYAPNLIKADIRIRDHRRKTYDREWYVSLIKFLSEFNGCKTADMAFPSKLALIVPAELRKIYDQPFRDLKYLTVKTPNMELHRKKMFRDSLRWIAPSLETLTIEQEQDYPRRFSLPSR